ncbi:hypothetical protein COHA_007846 [Chlorella ohadii]|uniref:ABC transmembrane type-1 domain-containing protein n=1 Tax=Chlorella ohadii TaxID=2649997 RepID=A0AAD5DL25_9CHLO|nr:hypothetical protein COHA_007846 [Chlorella ohadii]
MIVIIPFMSVFVEAFRHGLGPFIETIQEPDFQQAVKMTLALTAVATPINALFGIRAALFLARNEFPGKPLAISILDLPFSISPVITGMMFVLLYGRKGLFAPLIASGMLPPIVFAFPGMALATLFVTMPFVVRELLPILEQMDLAEEEAARSLGATDFQVFMNVTLPNIRWGLLYGLILTNARAMGEFGAVAVISGNIIGQTQTLTLFVESAYKEYNSEAAFAAAVLLSFLALFTLVVKDRLEGQRRPTLLPGTLPSCPLPHRACAPGPFIVRQQATQVVVTSGGQPVLPLAGSGGSGLPLVGSGGSGTPVAGNGSSIDATFLQQYYASLGGNLFGGLPMAGNGGSGLPLGGSGGSGIALAGSGMPLVGALSMPEQQFAVAGSGMWPDGSAAGFPSSLSLPLPAAGGGYAGAPAPMQQGGAAAAARGPKARKARPYKPPDQVQAEKKKKAEVQAYCRQLEQQLGRARAELEKLQQENKALQTKAVVLNRHTSFRRSAAAIAQELTSLTTSSSTDWSQASSQQRALDAALKGLPGPEALEQLRSMSLEQAVQFYNSVVSQVRDLLHRMEQGPDPQRAKEQLEELFSLEAEKGGTFGYLQVVSPEVFAELMQAKLDPSSPVDRQDPAHWRSVLAAMSLTQEQEAELILLLQWHLKQASRRVLCAEQIVQRKSQVMQQLAAELSSGLLSLELSSTGSGELSAALSGGTALSDDAEVERRSSSEGTLPAQTELDRLIQLEYWLKYDFSGCVRKLLPARQQALCMVASYPFYPDQRQLEGAIKDKAGQLWEQLQRAA